MVTLWRMDDDVRIRSLAGLFMPYDIKRTSLVHFAARKTILRAAKTAGH
jgi:hypothetical protein